MFNYALKTFKIQNPTSKLLGFADVIIDDKMVVSGFKIFQGPKGLFVKAPSHDSKKQDENGKNIWYDDVRFIDAKENEDAMHTPFQKELFDAILVEFQKAGGAAQPAPQGKPTSPKEPSAPWY